MLTIRVDNPAGLCPPMGLYSHVSQAEGNRFVFVAGQVGLDRQGALVGEGDIGEQVRQAYKSVGMALESAEAGWADLAETTTYLVSEERIEAFFTTRDALFSSLFPSGDYPPNTLIVVPRLVRPELLVEIEAIAVVG